MREVGKEGGGGREKGREGEHLLERDDQTQSIVVRLPLLAHLPHSSYLLLSLSSPCLNSQRTASWFSLSPSRGWSSRAGGKQTSDYTSGRFHQDSMTRVRAEISVLPADGNGPSDRRQCCLRSSSSDLLPFLLLLLLHLLRCQCCGIGSLGIPPTPAPYTFHTSLFLSSS